MKALLIILIFLSKFSFGATYYVKVAGGVGSGLDTTNAWSYAKFNSVGLSPGDSVLFKRGDVFYGNMSTRSGSLGSPVVYDAYGIGANPVITGLITLSSWTLSSGNIYYTSLTTLTLNLVTIDGVVTAMGRTPNIGTYYHYQTHSSNTSITSSDLTGTPDWTGAQVVIRKARWIWDIQTKAVQSGSTISYSAISQYGNNNAYSPVNLNGFFIQKHIGTLDQNGEWFFDSTAQRLYVYYSGGLGSHVVKASNVDINFSLSSKSYVTINNLDFEGSNTKGANLSAAVGIRINNCNFYSQGGTAIYVNGVTHLAVNNCTVNNSLNAGIWVQQNGIGDSVLNTTVNNSGMIVGAAKSGDGTEEGIFIVGDSTYILNCTVKNSGYSGINFQGNTQVIKYNFVDSSCLNKDDGGGIYTYGGTGGAQNRIVKNNIVTNSIGALYGAEANTANEPFGKAAGIYLDNLSYNVNIDSNTVAHSGWGGIFIHSSDSCQITNNICYDNLFGVDYEQYIGAPIRGMTRKNNQFIAKTGLQFPMYFHSYINENPNLTGTSDSNYFSRPVGDNKTMWVNVEGVFFDSITLATWQSTYSLDAHSQKAVKTITDVSLFRLEINPSASIRIVSLSRKYIGMDGTLYNGGSVSIPPYYSILMIDNGPLTNVSQYWIRKHNIIFK